LSTSVNRGHIGCEFGSQTRLTEPESCRFFV
jgi:hypothetical protein